STVSSDAAFFWDNANKRLGIGNAAPSATLNVTGDEVIDAGSSFFGLRINGTLGSFGPAILLDNGTQSWGIAAGLAASDFIITKSSGTSFTPFTIKNTGFDNEMVLGTNGVGINTASPNDLLEVVGAGTAIRATDGSVVTRLFSSSATGLGYVGTNSANGFALRTGGTDQFTIDTNGDLFPAASGQSIIFPAQAGDNTSGEIIMFNGCCSNGRRAIIGHSPGFPDWGLSYDDTGDDFYFATQLTATPDLAIDMGGAAVYVGSTVTGTGASLYRATTGRLTGSQANGVQFDGFGTAGIFVEDAGAEGGGFFANGNTAAIWSPGDSNGVLSVYDEDFFSGATPPTAEMRVQSGGYLSTKSLLGGGSTLCYTTATFTGYNTLSNCVSSRRYKENIAPLPIDTGKVLQLQPVKFTWKKIHHDAVERNGKTETPAYDEQFTGPTVGLIAEDVAPLLPDIITYKDGQVEGIEYKLLSVYELAVLKKHEADIEALKLGAGIAPNGTMTVNELDADVVKARVFYVRNSGANKTAGTGVIPPGAASIMVQNANVDAKSLLSVTFKDDPGGSWWIGEQAAGSFMVHVSAPAAAALHFTYWIVGLQDGVSP
ncbi:MAG TPA: tail fiber domain-containing protein, partial [Candidatus Binatia bacterium]|nr:tail fiber domain-containing protein [Candidatus Binatia bacterium]